jgi:hypothetical protein
MRRLLVRRTHSVREQEQMQDSMMDIPDDDGGAAAAATGNATSQQQPIPPSPSSPSPSPSPARPLSPPPLPAPRPRMNVLCRTLAILAAAYGIYVLAAFFGTALAGVVAASVTHPPVAAAAVCLWLASELFFYLFFWRPRYRQLDAQRLGSPGVAPPSRLAAMAQFERLLALRGRLRTAAVARGTPPSSPRSADAKTRSISEQERAEVEMYLSGWFRGCDASKVRRGNVADLISMGFWYQNHSSDGSGDRSSSAATKKNGNSADDGQAQGRQQEDPNPPPTPAELEAMVSRLERAWGLSFPPGRDPRGKKYSDLFLGRGRGGRGGEGGARRQQPPLGRRSAAAGPGAPPAAAGQTGGTSNPRQAGKRCFRTFYSFLRFGRKSSSEKATRGQVGSQLSLEQLRLSAWNCDAYSSLALPAFGGDDAMKKRRRCRASSCAVPAAACASRKKN